MKFAFESFPELRTQRLLLRKIISSDIPQVFEGLSDPDVTAYYAVHFSSLKETRSQMKYYQDTLDSNSGIWWGISKKEENLLIGTIGLYEWGTKDHIAEIGYWLLPEYWGKGFMTEAISEILHFGFNHMKLLSIKAVVEPENLNSIKLLQGFGFQFKLREEKAEVKNGNYINLDTYILTNIH